MADNENTSNNAAIRGYLIDSEHQTIKEVAGYREINRALGCASALRTASSASGSRRRLSVERGMFMIHMPKTFSVGDTKYCRIDGELNQVTWRDENTLVIEPDDVRAIVTRVNDEGNLVCFVCGDAGKSAMFAAADILERAGKRFSFWYRLILGLMILLVPGTGLIAVAFGAGMAAMLAAVDAHWPAELAFIILFFVAGPIGAFFSVYVWPSLWEATYKAADAISQRQGGPTDFAHPGRFQWVGRQPRRPHRQPRVTAGDVLKRPRPCAVLWQRHGL
jgi:hypothetical protein